MGEIVNDSLAGMATFGYRVEVRDVQGDVRSVLFYPESGTFDLGSLKAGRTLFLRYAMRIHFSDLQTEAIKARRRRRGGGGAESAAAAAAAARRSPLAALHTHPHTHPHKPHTHTNRRPAPRLLTRHHRPRPRPTARPGGRP